MLKLECSDKEAPDGLSPTPILRSLLPPAQHQKEWTPRGVVRNAVFASGVCVYLAAATPDRHMLCSSSSYLDRDPSLSLAPTPTLHRLLPPHLLHRPGQRRLHLSVGKGREIVIRRRNILLELSIPSYQPRYPLSGRRKRGKERKGKERKEKLTINHSGLTAVTVRI